MSTVERFDFDFPHHLPDIGGAFKYYGRMLGKGGAEIIMGNTTE